MGTGVSPPPWSPNPRIIPLALSARLAPTVLYGSSDYARLAPTVRFEAEACQLARAAAPGAEALDLASFRRRDVVRAPSHLAHEPLLLHLAAELPKRLLELLGILDDYAHNPETIPVSITSLPSPAAVGVSPRRRGGGARGGGRRHPTQVRPPSHAMRR